MSLNTLYNGIGGTLGDSLALAKPLMLSGNVWYVSSARGTDAASPAGQNREKPLATLQQAVTNASAADVIVLLSDHAESISSTVSIAKQLIIVGEGSSGGNPTATLTQGADTTMISLATSGIELRNIKFPEPAIAIANPRVSVVSSGVWVDGCRFEVGKNTDVAAFYVTAGSDTLRVTNSTWISVATDRTLQPVTSFYFSGAVSDVVLDGLVFSDGEVGYSNIYSLDASAGAITRLRATNISLLLGADLKFHASSTGLINVATATGGGKVVW